jgi:hypothetical protein
MNRHDLDEIANSPEAAAGESRRRRRFARVSLGITAVIILTAVIIAVGAYFASVLKNGQSVTVR